MAAASRTEILEALAGASVAEVASRLGVSRQWVYWVRGRAPSRVRDDLALSKRTIDALAKALGSPESISREAVAAVGYDELRGLHWIGPAALEEITAWLAAGGIAFGPPQTRALESVDLRSLTATDLGSALRRLAVEAQEAVAEPRVAIARARMSTVAAALELLVEMDERSPALSRRVQIGSVGTEAQPE